jgi:prolipoprotein diacylglyceryltransferase
MKMALGSLLYIVGLIAAVWVIYDVFAVNKKLNTTAKVVWTLAALLFSIITAVVYYFMEKKK